MTHRRTLSSRVRSAGRLILVNVVAAAFVVPHSLRRRLMILAGHRIGTDTTIFPRSIFRTGRLVVGDGCFVNYSVLFLDGDITLGDSVFVGPGTILASGHHEVGPSRKRVGPTHDQPIVIEDGCWIGARVVVRAGVTIARGCVVGAGAVVTSDTEPNGVYGGVPAVRIFDLSEDGKTRTRVTRPDDVD